MAGVRIGKIRIDVEVDEVLRRAGLQPILQPLWREDDPYPWVQDFAGKLIVHLHLWVYDYFSVMGVVPPRRARDVVHHNNEKKTDARIANLRAMSEADHTELHNTRRKAKRQRFTPKPSQDLYGFYRPHAPAPVQCISFTKSSFSMPADSQEESQRRATKAARRTLKKRLSTQAMVLTGRAAHLDSKRAIPKPPRRSSARWNEAKSVLVGARERRLGCYEDERAVVLALALFETRSLVTGERTYDRTGTAKLLGITALELGSYMKRLPVKVALERWERYQRLPLKESKPSTRPPGKQEKSTRTKRRAAAKRAERTAPPAAPLSSPPARLFVAPGVVLRRTGSRSL